MKINRVYTERNIKARTQVSNISSNIEDEDPIPISCQVGLAQLPSVALSCGGIVQNTRSGSLKKLVELYYQYINTVADLPAITFPASLNFHLRH